MQLCSEVKLNYYALCICILTERVPEEAFKDMVLESGTRLRYSSMELKNNNAPEEVREILRLKKTLTWKQIGEIYGISDQAAYQRVRRFSGGGSSREG